MGVWLGPRGLPKYKKPPAFTYTGVHELRQRARADGTVDWELVLKSSGVLTFTRVVEAVDVFLVGPGANGATGSAVSTTAVGGKGGNGGEVKTVYRVPVSPRTAYTTVIGAPGGSTSIALRSDCNAVGGAGKTGGDGARAANGNRQAAGNGTPGTLSFDGTVADGSDGRLFWYAVRFGASGGGGGANSPNGTAANPGSSASSNSGAGGAYNSTGAAASLANSGAGGGGGGSNLASGYTYYPGGAGATGIIIIRNAR